MKTILNTYEKNLMVYLMDKTMCLIEKEADREGIDIDGSPWWLDLATEVTKIDMDSPEVELDTVLALTAELQRFHNSIKRHVWELVSNYTGEIFNLVGEPGQKVEETMERQGFNPKVWEVSQQLK